ncbi:MAG: putative molybdenum carrier protein [Bacteroidetes bacterium]|nr:putative molybdenum carrier protein [Bacteroidota bacterium]
MKRFIDQIVICPAKSINSSVLISNLTIVCGGQTGVDRASLDSAIKWGISYRGWCPAGRWAEDGLIDERYELRMTPTEDPGQRTVWNVRESNGVLIIGSMYLSAGTNLAHKTAKDLDIPVIHAQLDHEVPLVIKWLKTLDAPIVNIAGPRESEDPGIYFKSLLFLDELIATIKNDDLPSH